jgi:hypothetical protein
MLTDRMIQAAKPAEKPYRLTDEKGLVILITPAGTRLWRFRYRFPRSGPAKREKTWYWEPNPEVSLKEARDERDEARRDLRHGIDPSVRRQAEKHSAANTFEAVARELLSILRKASLVLLISKGAEGASWVARNT